MPVKKLRKKNTKTIGLSKDYEQKIYHFLVPKKIDFEVFERKFVQKYENPLIPFSGREKVVPPSPGFSGQSPPRDNPPDQPCAEAGGKGRKTHQTNLTLNH